jgi:hypothetical protein
MMYPITTLDNNFLKGTKKGFVPVPPVQSGFMVHGDVRSIAVVRTKDNGKLVIAAVNNDSLRVFRIRPERLPDRFASIR